MTLIERYAELPTLTPKAKQAIEEIRQIIKTAEEEDWTREELVKALEEIGEVYER